MFSGQDITAKGLEGACAVRMLSGTLILETEQTKGRVPPASRGCYSGWPGGFEEILGTLVLRSSEYRSD